MSDDKNKSASFLFQSGRSLINSVSKKFDISSLNSFLHKPSPSFLFQSGRSLIKSDYNSAKRSIVDAGYNLGTPYTQPSLSVLPKRLPITSILKRMNKPISLVRARPDMSSSTSFQSEVSAQLEQSQQLDSTQKVDEGYKPLFSSEKEFNDAAEAKRKKHAEYLKKLQLLCENKIVVASSLDESANNEEFNFDMPVVRGPRKRTANDMLFVGPVNKSSKPDSALEKELTGANVSSLARLLSARKWTCQICMVKNDEDRARCSYCKASKSKSVRASGTPRSTSKRRTSQVSSDIFDSFGPKLVETETPKVNAPFSLEFQTVNQTTPFNLGGNATLANSNPFTFASNAQTNNNYSTPFGFGDAAMNSGTPSPVNALSTSIGSMSRRNLATKRRKPI